MMTHLTEEEIGMCADALQEESYYQLPQRIRAHLAECDQCAEEVLMVADLSEEIDFSMPEKRRGFLSNRRILAWGISVAASIALLFIVFHGSRNSDDVSNYLTQEQQLSETSDQKEQARDTVSEDEPVKEEQVNDEVLSDEETSPQIAQNQEETAEVPSNGEQRDNRAPAAAMPPGLEEDETDTLKFLARSETNEKLEKLVERFQGNLRNDTDVRVKTPVTIRHNEGSVVIKWENPDRKRLIIEVFDNQGERIFEAETRDQEYTLRNLSKGLYYWKLISGKEFDLLFCGRILIE